MVGCVIVRGDRVLGEGFHRSFGKAHAEIEALKKADDVRGATVYVMLEPCCHHGKTPPCVEALIRAGVERVVAAVQDPNPLVAGQGFAALRKAGIRVDVGVCAAQAQELISPFAHRLQTGRPWVIAKWAQTLDGCIATSTGDSRWISNEHSRTMVHRLRARVDAVLVGIGTVLADDPMLNAREVPRRRIARRVVIDPSLRLPLKSKLVRTVASHDLPLTVATSKASAKGAAAATLRERGVEVIALPRLGEGLGLSTLLAHLASTHAATNVLAEGGAGLLGSLFAQQLVQEAQVFIAPKLLGDAAGLHAVQRGCFRQIAEALPLELVQQRRCDGDVWLRYLSRGTAGGAGG